MSGGVRPARLSGLIPPDFTPLADVVSVFMLPAVGRNAVVDVLGAHELDREAGLPQAFGRVWVVAADFEFVAEAYGAGRRAPELVPLLRPPPQAPNPP